MRVAKLWIGVSPSPWRRWAFFCAAAAVGSARRHRVALLARLGEPFVVEEQWRPGAAQVPFFGTSFAQPVDDPSNKPRSKTYLMDITHLDNSAFVERFEDGTVGLDRNFAVKDGKLYIASYTSGTRVLRIVRNEEGKVGLAPYAHMATEPRRPNRILNINQEENFGSAFLGHWGIYPLFDSGAVIATDINNGLIVMRLSEQPCKGTKCSK